MIARNLVKISNACYSSAENFIVISCHQKSIGDVICASKCS